MKALEIKKSIQNVIKSMERDPILKILLENSHLTKIQLETFLIDILSKYNQENRIKSEEKTYFRIRGKVSRGSFNRTLKQAKKNIIRSIYTILLLGYLKIADSTTLILRHLEISNRLREYVEMQKELRENVEGRNMVRIIQEELEKALKEEI
ncbi:MAG: hypothetical protein B6U77_01975 [Candidatus Hecatellales archaeon ex4484_218]|nr:MAG: hypothetical protein B6U77_01975 [Candidatus Hecatellales archaeon ex4484_218]